MGGGQINWISSLAGPVVWRGVVPFGLRTQNVHITCARDMARQHATTRSLELELDFTRIGGAPVWFVHVRPNGNNVIAASLTIANDDDDCGVVLVVDLVSPTHRKPAHNNREFNHEALAYH